MRQLLSLIVGFVLVEVCFSQASKAETIFYSLDSSSSPQPMTLVRFSSDPGNTNVTVVAELPGLIPNPVDAHMDLSTDGKLYLSPQDNTIYSVNPGDGMILDSISLPHDNDDIVNGIAVRHGGLVYVVQDLNGPGTRLWAVDFVSRQATRALHDAS